MALLFDLSRYYRMQIDNAAATRGSNFSVQTSNGRQQLLLEFSWNKKNQFYTVDIFDAVGNHLKQWHLTMADMSVIISGFDVKSKTAPDLFLHMRADDPDGDAPKPSTVGVTHNLRLLTGVQTSERI